MQQFQENGTSLTTLCEDQVQQILGLGYLRNEELSGQLADQNPAIKRFIMEAFAERTGKTGQEAFNEAMSKRQVSVQDVLRGYEKSAQEAAGRVDELSNSIEGANARLQNMRFAEEMERTVSGPMSKAALEYTEAQRKLTEATQPLRDSMYNVAAAGTSLAAKFLTWGSGVIRDPLKSIFGDDETNTGGATGSWGDPVSAPEASPQPPAIRTVPKLSADWGIPAAKLEQMLAKQDPLKVLALQDVSRWNKPPALSMPSTASITKLQEKPRQPITYPKPEWQQAAEQYAPSSPDALMQQFTQRSNVSVQSSVSFQQGAFQIQTQATDAQTLAAELQPLIQEQFDSSLQRTLSEVDASFGSK